LHAEGKNFDYHGREESWPPNQAPPPGLTDCSTMAILTEGFLPSS